MYAERRKAAQVQSNTTLTSKNHLCSFSVASVVALVLMYTAGGAQREGAAPLQSVLDFDVGEEHVAFSLNVCKHPSSFMVIHCFGS